MTAISITWIRAGDLAQYLEHDGSINGDGYLAALDASGETFDEDHPAVLLVWIEDSVPVATLFDGNHRLLLALERDPQDLIPVHIRRDDTIVSTMPGTALTASMQALVPVSATVGE